uniref:CD99 antigen-like protein 2 n=1 Tax=Ficedula albicollis TaxID=59894 RepID=U3KCB3_FICAL
MFQRVPSFWLFFFLPSDNTFWDVIRTTTKQPKTTRAPPKRNPEKDPMDFNLADALDDGKDAGRPDVRPGEEFSDDDLASIVDGGYSPDKKKGASGNTDNDYSGVAETGTIAGIASGLAMALIGAVSSYISYQQKKFCFSIQQGLNTEYVKGENMEAVVSEEPQDVIQEQMKLRNNGVVKLENPFFRVKF